ncbi:hypothetical protein Tco_0467871 [Tanacetum coccineum]
MRYATEYNDWDDDFINDEDDVSHDLADSDDEVLANDDECVMSASVARGHDGDGGDDDPRRPPLRSIRISCRGEGGRKPNMGGRAAGILGTRGETMNLRLKKNMDEWGPLKIRFNTLPEPFKMLKTGQRARSSVGRDPGHLFSLEISRWRAQRLESTRPSSRPSSTHIRMVANMRRTRRGDDPAEGSRNQYADGCALHRGPDNGHVRSDDQMSQLLTQLESQHEVCGGNESGEIGDDEPGADEDADGDEEF